MLQKIIDIFSEKYGETPFVFRSPGRVNIIGEHTDYNEGFVLPGAIDKYIYVGIGKRDDNMISLYAADFDEHYTGDIKNVHPSQLHWPNYILGVVDQFQKSGCPLTGFNLVVDGDVPVGAGLSSSAAMECAAAFAINELYELEFDKLSLVKMAQRAEHLYAKVKVGIMDMFASMFGKKDHVLKLDCRSLEYELIPCNLEGYKLILLNTNVKHSLASSEYNVRREQCEAGVALVKEKYPEVMSLRDVTIEMLRECVENTDALVFKRCKFVVEENERLLQACEDLKYGDLQSLGEKMYRTHLGLKDEYEVSCKELDFLVDNVKDHPSVAGARMMGGGFGGCTINLVKENDVDALIEEMSVKYTEAMNLPLTAYTASIGGGTCEMRLP